mmetsp:Transcript_9538/g.24242  ORF Transcript_9538/g.24242 Transcript_9538/m.24242 type:complete len:362 (-) Transcript_9538:967-2052(-)
MLARAPIRCSRCTSRWRRLARQTAESTTPFTIVAAPSAFSASHSAPCIALAEAPMGRRGRQAAWTEGSGGSGSLSAGSNVARVRVLAPSWRSLPGARLGAPRAALTASSRVASTKRQQAKRTSATIHDGRNAAHRTSKPRRGGVGVLHHGAPGGKYDRRNAENWLSPRWRARLATYRRHTRGPCPCRCVPSRVHVYTEVLTPRPHRTPPYAPPIARAEMTDTSEGCSQPDQLHQTRRCGTARADVGRGARCPTATRASPRDETARMHGGTSEPPLPSRCSVRLYTFLSDQWPGWLRPSRSESPMRTAPAFVSFKGSPPVSLALLLPGPPPPTCPLSTIDFSYGFGPCWRTWPSPWNLSGRK